MVVTLEDGREYDATKIGSDKESDIALLQTCGVLSFWVNCSILLTWETKPRCVMSLSKCAVIVFLKIIYKKNTN